MKQLRRSGFSLLEVMLATAVLLGSVIVLSHISFVGTAHMDAAEQYAAAQLVCQARMNEMLSGALPIEEVRGQAIPELPGWGLTVKVESASQAGLLAIEVTAAEHAADEIVQVVSESMLGQPEEVNSDVLIGSSQQDVHLTGQEVGRGKQFTLVHWIAEPEGSELSQSVIAGMTSPAVDLPVEASFFDDSSLPGEAMFPEEPIPPGGASMPEEPLLPEEPSIFEEPLPEF